MSIDTFDKMSAPELVAIILGKNRPDHECVRLAACVLSDGDTLYSDLVDAVWEQTATAARHLERVQAAIELGSRSIKARRPRNDIKLRGPEDVVSLMEPVYSRYDTEAFYCLCLNSKNGLKKMIEVSIGSLNASIVHPRELFRKAVEVSAASVILVHNHPSGDPKPSSADITLTKRIVKAGDVLGIDVFDHVIIGGGGAYTSMSDEGLI